MGGISVITSVLLAMLVVVVAFDPIKETCNEIECPNSLFQIRLYNSSVWISTERFRDPSLYIGTAFGMSVLDAYFNGRNEENKVLKQAAPTLTQLHDRLWPTLISVSRYLPAENHANPPPANGFHFNKWESPTFVVVKQVQGIVSDSTVAQEAASLKKSLEGSICEKIIKNCRHPSTWNTYVALFEPFTASHIMTNYEIWITFELKDEESIKTF